MIEIKTAIYQEEDWKSEVKILEDNSCDEWERYKLEVVKTIKESSFLKPVKDGHVFEVNYRKGLFNYCYNLRIL